jgi:hypothetical protein
MPEAIPHHRFQAAYHHLLPALLAIPPEQVVKPRLDIATAGSLVLGAMPALAAYVDQMKALPLTSNTLVEELPERAMAMLHAQALYVGAVRAPSSLPALAERGATLRNQLLRAADLLIAFGVPLEDPVAAIRTGTGYQDLAMDLLVLAHLFRQNWSAAKGATPVTSELLDETATLGDQILTALGERDRDAESPDETTDLRDRAYTHFLESYDEVRRALAYLCRQREDAEAILPSLFAASRKRKAGGAGGNQGPG